MSESKPALDRKTGRLLPPVTCSAGRCEWLYNDRGYQCSEPAVWCHPNLDEQFRFKWVRMCDAHKSTLIEKMAEAGVKPHRDHWQRIDQQNDRLQTRP